MTVREQIIDSLYNGLGNITVANGYDNTIVEVRKGIVNSSVINSFPILTVQPGSEVLQTQIEGQQEGLYSIDCFIIGYTNSNDITGSVESLLSDIKRYLYKDNNLSSSVVCALLDIDYIQGYEIKEVNPYLAYTNNICSFGVLLKIEYVDFVVPAVEITLDAPVLTSPSNGYSAASLHQALVWGTVTNAQYYHIRVYDNDGILIIDQDNLTNTSYTIPADITFNNDDVITWKVRAKAAQIFSEWSATWSYTIDDTTIVPLNPSQISNNNLWLRSDLGITLTSDRVSAWADQSAGGGNVIQATSTRRPVIQAAAYNGVPSLYFNPNWAGAGETLSHNDTTSKYAFTSANQATLMFTFMSDGTKFDFNSSYFSPFTRSNSNFGSQYAFVRGINTGPGSNQLGYPFPSGDYQTIPFSLNVPHQIIVVKDATNHKIYLDGNKIGEITKTPTSFGNEIASYLNIGSTYNTGDANGKFTGHFFEAAFWNKLLTEDEIQSLYAYHSNFFNL